MWLCHAVTLPCWQSTKCPWFPTHYNETTKVLYEDLPSHKGRKCEPIASRGHDKCSAARRARLPRQFQLPNRPVEIQPLRARPPRGLITAPWFDDLDSIRRVNLVLCPKTSHRIPRRPKQMHSSTPLTSHNSLGCAASPPYLLSSRMRRMVCARLRGCYDHETPVTLRKQLCR